MATTKRFSPATAYVLATLLAIAGVLGCGGGTSAVKADAVVVTYYYLPL